MFSIVAFDAGVGGFCPCILSLMILATAARPAVSTVFGCLQTTWTCSS
jgi:hypothetical protein